MNHSDLRSSKAIMEQRYRTGTSMSAPKSPTPRGRRLAIRRLVGTWMIRAGERLVTTAPNPV